MKKRVAIGLSGGVDSAVSAALLLEQGYEVIGVFMKNWSDDFGLAGSCPWEQDQADAKAVAEHLGIPFLSYNFELQYREKVMDYFFEEYKKGLTPNPDILCNSEIKFNVFLKKCLDELNVDYIATGHYARVISSSCHSGRIPSKQDEIRNPGSTKANFDTLLDSRLRGNDKDTFHLLKGLDASKDQSYFLCRLTQEELSRSLFPVGHLHKSEVRKIAEELKLPVAQKKDSQGICFVGKINVKKFLESELGMKPGRIIDIDTGKDMGEHKGLWFYTIGQREGLGFGGGPWFVVGKDIKENRIFIAKGKDNIHLFRKEVEISELQIINYELLIKNWDRLEVSLRYRQVPARCKIDDCTRYKLQDSGGSLEICELEFETPQRAVSPGQFACIYVGDEVVASGVIA
jgi:tRNA-specific 2-thiouridylase